MCEAFENYFMKGYCEKKKFVLPALLSRYTILMHRLLKFNTIIQENAQTVQAQEVQAQEVPEKVEGEGQVEAPEGEEQQVETPEGEEQQVFTAPEPVNPLKFVAEYAKENLNFLENAAYLSEEEKARFDYTLSSINVTVVQLAEKSQVLIDDIAGDFPDLAITFGLDLSVAFSVCDFSRQGDDLQFGICSDILERFEDEINDT